MTTHLMRSAVVALVGVSLPLVATATATAGTSAGPRTTTRPPVHQLVVPQVVGHRGAPGYRPEHTLAGYELAIEMGADYIEPDLVSTKDGVLVARHENDITGTTDVADHPEFADRRTTKTIDGAAGDRLVHRGLHAGRAQDAARQGAAAAGAPGQHPLRRPLRDPDLRRGAALVRSEEKRLHRTIGVAPETKHPTYFDSIGLSPEEPMLRTLHRFHLDTRRSKVLIQSFEVGNLQQLNRMTDLPLEQLTEASGAPYDKEAAGDPTTYADMTTAAGLRHVATYADWLGPDKDQVLPRNPATGATGAPSNVVRDSHAAGLHVVIYTIRDENQFMATNFRRGTDPNAKGDVHAEIFAFLDAGVDAFFADYPDSGVDARDDWLS